MQEHVDGRKARAWWPASAVGAEKNRATGRGHAPSPPVLRSERQPQRGGVATVVDEPGRRAIARPVLVHDRALFGIVEIVHLQADLDVIGELVEDRAIQLAVGVAEHRQLPGAGPPSLPL